MATPEEEEHLTYGPKSIRSFIKLSLCFEFLASNYVMFYWKFTRNYFGFARNIFFMIIIITCTNTNVTKRNQLSILNKSD